MKFECPSCKKFGQVDDPKVPDEGMYANCPTCKTRFLISKPTVDYTFEPAQIEAKQQGNLSNVKWFAGIGEYRLDWGPGYRVYIGKDGDKLIVLLGGGTKKGQRKDIANAETIWKDYKERKANQKKK